MATIIRLSTFWDTTAQESTSPSSPWDWGGDPYPAMYGKPNSQIGRIWFWTASATSVSAKRRCWRVDRIADLIDSANYNVGCASNRVGNWTRRATKATPSARNMPLETPHVPLIMRECMSSEINSRQGPWSHERATPLRTQPADPSHFQPQP
jgi:hypothetical protein